ncbi:phage holin family protein [Actinoalloteichus sp. AHMU CJ021]|uniref:Membrane protein n=1 Tax=Actinoalloteichus caeruleus DSM 43889 TaxID=1120930 RepID=A0ABT1JC40_ACTCY|nr:phage holin family protein [Actinoalloteichus caeruleus]AUS80675.1 phage holin family protein [Actinoalloteichus sp. AHMU CJ021]MCP2330060.1 putative membrane protein [Actinoalloteichus caeruleus DSM 43889]
MVLILHVLITAVAVWATTLLPGVQLEGGTTGARLGTLLVVAVIVGLVNAVLKPVAKTVGCLFYLLTFGLIGLVVNGLLFMFASWIAQQFGLPFSVSNFWSAVLAGLIVSIVSAVLYSVTRKVIKS